MRARRRRDGAWHKPRNGVGGGNTALRAKNESKSRARTQCQEWLGAGAEPYHNGLAANWSWNTYRTVANRNGWRTESPWGADTTPVEDRHSRLYYNYAKPVIAVHWWHCSSEIVNHAYRPPRTGPRPGGGSFGDLNPYCNSAFGLDITADWEAFVHWTVECTDLVP